MTKHALRATAHVIFYNDSTPASPDQIPTDVLADNGWDGARASAMIDFLKQPNLEQQPKTDWQRDLLLICVGIRIGVAAPFLARPQSVSALSPAESCNRFNQLFRLWEQLGLTVVDETLLSDAIARHPKAARDLKSAFRRLRP